MLVRLSTLAEARTAAGWKATVSDIIRSALVLGVHALEREEAERAPARARKPRAAAKRGARAQRARGQRATNVKRRRKGKAQ